ncbi:MULTISPECIES: HAD-IA family hydrolase [unclassified Actinotalea]|uniref:HAD-IA family hydrolase n=1 Tax=unclassified Actinotalea TaxID=2638618 RepID=UPI0015F76D29|nr:MULTISPECIES: HAD-IA family hydrolase [unclassified Actinotalea]
MSRQIDAVLFDLGQVLVRWEPRLPYVGRHDDASVTAFFEEVDFAAFNHAQDAGRTWAQARDALAASHPHHLPMLDTYVAHFRDALPGPVDGAPQVVADLRAAGMRLLGLTNWSAETFHHAAQAAPVVAELEDVLVSGREGLAKPDPRIFALAVTRFGLDAGRTLFVDDSPANVAAAGRAGLRAHHFTSHAALRRHLGELGVDLGAGATTARA